MQKTYKPLIVLIAALSFCFSHPTTLNSKGLCAGYDGYVTSIFWNPEIINQPDNLPFLFTFDRLYSYTWDDPAYKYKDNSQEWITFCNNKPTRADVDSLLYRFTLTEVEAMRTWIKSNKRPNLKIESNSFAAYLKNNDRLDVADYLVFAKKCEPYVSAGDEEAWEARPERAAAPMRKMYQEAQKFYETANNSMLKYRYAFQAIRLAHYCGDENQAIGMYDKMFEAVKVNTVIKWWALNMKAGALKNLGKAVEANYYFIQVFNNCPSKRVHAYYDFQIQDDEMWKNVLSMCKNNSEKCTMYMLRAMNPYARTTTEMREIYNIDPSSEYLSLLLVREINKLETTLMGEEFDFQFPISIKYQPPYQSEDNQMTASYLYDLKQFVSEINSIDVPNQNLWTLADMYLNYLSGDFKKAQLLGENIAARGVNTTEQKQLMIFNFLLEVSQLKSLNADIENRIFEKYAKLKPNTRYNDPFYYEYNPAKYDNFVYDCMLKNFAKIYGRQGDYGKQILCQKGHYPFFSVKNCNIEALEQLIKMAENPASEFEKHLLTRIDPTYGKDILWDILGTQYLIKGDVNEALTAYASLSKAYKTADEGYFLLQANPFDESINDCHDCAYEKYAENTTFTKEWFATELVRLQKEIDTNPKNYFAINNYKMGVAWYNVSYFGPAWKATAFQRGGSDLGMMQTTPDEYYTAEMIEEIKSFSNVDMERPLKYLNLALSVSPDKELLAKTLFMKAKCTQNQSYLNVINISERDKNFARLQSECAKTQYYQQVIKECSYFREYVKK